MWNNLAARLANITLNHKRDEFKWNLDQAGVFTVKSHYLGLMHQNIPYTNKKLWKFKIPLKINIFMWYPGLAQGGGQPGPTEKRGPTSIVGIII